MKNILISSVILIAISVLSCTTDSPIISPTGSARAGSNSGGGGGGGSTTPPPSTTSPSPTTLPVLAPNPTPIYDLGPIMPTGTWTVKSYYRTFSNNTSDYAGYKLVFTSGLVTATDNKGNVYTGSWYATVGGQIPYYGGAPSVTALTMSFAKSAPNPLKRLTATWNVNLATTPTDVVLDNFEPLSGERIEFSL